MKKRANINRARNKMRERGRIKYIETESRERERKISEKNKEMQRVKEERDKMHNTN